MVKRKVDYAQLDTFLQTVDDVSQTTRRASEIFYNCPPIDMAVQGERQMRALIDNMYADYTQGDARDEVLYSQENDDSFVANVKNAYWEPVVRVKEQVVAFGAADHGFIDDYFKVRQTRLESSIRRNVRDQYPNGSPAIHLLNSVEAYGGALDIDVMTAARLTTTHLQTVLPSMKHRAALLVDEGMNDVAATKEVFRELAEDIVPAHIEKARQLVADGRSVSSLINKPAFYSDSLGDQGVSPPLRLGIDDARGMMELYPLERMPYSEEELMLGDSIIQDPRLQSALLLFQMASVDHMKQYLTEHPERMQDRDRLLPFTELFVIEEGNDDPSTALVQNPKLVKVLCNNIVPAIAGTMIKEGVSLDTITSAQIAESVQDAKKRRVFQLQIGKFNNYDPLTNTVELDAVLNRVCPAMQTMTVGLEHWLPRIFDHCRDQVVV